MIRLKNIAQLSGILFLSILTACGGGSSSGNGASQAYNKAAIINLASPSFGDYDLAFIDLEQTQPSYKEGGFSGNGADFSLVAFGEHFYRIGRFNNDSITKFSISDAKKAIYQYSTLNSSDDFSSNPQTIVFVDENKAYLIQNEYSSIWVINPSATSQADFKISEIDLSHYIDASDTDGKPEIANAILIGDKLFVTVQRLSSWVAGSIPSYIVVIDTITDEEIDTNPSDSIEALKGIQLKTFTPDNLVYHEDLGLLVQSSGTHNCFACEPKTAQGGIELVNPTDYSTRILFNDTATQGFSQIAVLNENKAYAVRYNGWGDNDLVSFNPSDTSVPMEVVNSMQGMDLRYVTVNEDILWVSNANAGAPSVVRINTADDTYLDSFNTAFLPEKIVFAEVQ